LTIELLVVNGKTQKPKQELVVGCSGNKNNSRNKNKMQEKNVEGVDMEQLKK